jgi:hypothetical protein
MARQKRIPRAGLRRFPDKPMGDHGLHDWWYRCLANAGIVAQGTTSGERMHKARHTAGQRVLDATGNLKASRSCSATRRSRRPATSTPTGTSTSSRERRLQRLPAPRRRQVLP